MEKIKDRPIPEQKQRLAEEMTLNQILASGDFSAHTPMMHWRFPKEKTAIF